MCGRLEVDFDMKFTVIKNEDIDNYLPSEDIAELGRILHKIITGRHVDEKSIDNTYFVINIDEPYADQIGTILKQHGHCKEGYYESATKGNQ